MKITTETLSKGKATYKLQVPFKLLRTGDDGTKPLLVYLHGYGQTLDEIEQKFSPFLELDAYHLFIQGPYPLKLNSMDKKKAGYSYYIYDENDEAGYLQSLEFTSEFIQEIVDHQLSIINASRIGVIGYSMGAYLAGYWGFTRWKHSHEIVMINGRLKSELFKTKIENEDIFKHLNIIALNGSDDEIVDPVQQKNAIDYIRKFGLKADFRLIKANHKLNDNLIYDAKTWLLNLGYRKVNQALDI